MENEKDDLVLIIDNYDSFTYNLYQRISKINPNVKVYRNDKITVKEVEKMDPRFIVISPGPKAPQDAGISKEVIEKLGERIKILGVCLGHQSINEVFGGRTIRQRQVCHGKTSLIVNDQKSIFAGLPPMFKVARYHSLAADPNTFPGDLEITAWTSDGVIMGLRHKKYPIEGVQFHPESFLTEYGEEMLGNFFLREQEQMLLHFGRAGNYDHADNRKISFR